jgi:hypothetical protein
MKTRQAAHANKNIQHLTSYKGSTEAAETFPTIIFFSVQLQHITLQVRKRQTGQWPACPKKSIS